MVQDLLHAFPNQEKNEVVYVFARQFWLAFVPITLIFLFVFFLSLLGQYALGTNGSLFGAFSGTGILVIGVFQLFALIVYLVQILDFYYDILIVTDRRLVDIDQEQLFFRKVSTLNLMDVQDVNAEIKGPFHTMFNYGTVHIQTAGEKTNFVVPNVRYANEIAAIISSLAHQAKDDIPEEQRVPETPTIAVINSHPVSSLQELLAMGVIVPDDLRLVAKNENQ